MAHPPRTPSAGPEPQREPALARALEVATSGIMVCDAGARGRPILYVNRAFEELFGVLRDELVGRVPAVLVAETFPAQEQRELVAALAAGVAYEATATLGRRNGDPFRARMQITPVRSGDGELTEWIAVVDDVTERLEALDRLELAEARYRGLVEHVPAVTYVAAWDEDATLTYVSPQIEGLLGWPAEAFLADQGLWYRCVHPDDLDRVRAQ
ncbi:MAG TPA: PAS domain S-box protein, partial [Baekduia sp.]